jgi:hypothetical protein
MSIYSWIDSILNKFYYFPLVSTWFQVVLAQVYWNSWMKMRWKSLFDPQHHNFKNHLVASFVLTITKWNTKLEEWWPKYPEDWGWSNVIQGCGLLIPASHSSRGCGLCLLCMSLSESDDILFLHVRSGRPSAALAPPVCLLTLLSSCNRWHSLLTIVEG